MFRHSADQWVTRQSFQSGTMMAPARIKLQGRTVRSSCSKRPTRLLSLVVCELWRLGSLLDPYWPSVFVFWSGVIQPPSHLQGSIQEGKQHTGILTSLLRCAVCYFTRASSVIPHVILEFGIRCSVLTCQVMCDAYTPAGEPIPTNKRHAAAKIFSHPDVSAEEPWYVIFADRTHSVYTTTWPDALPFKKKNEKSGMGLNKSTLYCRKRSNGPLDGQWVVIPVLR